MLPGPTFTTNQVAASKPEKPVALLRPQNVKRAADWFINNFPGKVFYAVKSNPSQWLLNEVGYAGIEYFDVASTQEIKLFPDVSGDRLAFMHPIKSESAILEAFAAGVTQFSVDCIDEIKKIERLIGKRTNQLTLIIRVQADNTKSQYPLSMKFGCELSQLNDLLAKVRQLGSRAGVSFHVGSQCLDPTAYSRTITAIRETLHRPIDIIDVGGGFPVNYPHSKPPRMAKYMAEIVQALDGFRGEAWCEPGRAMSGESTSLLVRVDARKGNNLYINDGAYGCLFDAAHFQWQYPCRLARESWADAKEFSFYGPTCDSIDYMAGPFVLPDDIQAGDYIELGNLGAYGVSMTTRFNGFGDIGTALVSDDPWKSVFL